MKTRTGFTLLLFLTLLGTRTGMGQGKEQSHNGYWWVSSSEGFKLGFVTGYVMATGGTRDALFLKCVADKKAGLGDEVIKACEESQPVSMFPDFSNLKFGQLTEGVDEFYRDFRNKNLEIGVAMRYVGDQLKGKPAKELEEELTIWRRNAAK